MHRDDVPVRASRAVFALVVVFVITRAVTVWVAGSDLYRSHSPDVELYRTWAAQVLDGGDVPYRDFRIEYPPASLAPILVAGLATTGPGYAGWFATLMLLVDVAAGVALLALARRTGRWWGAWVWVLGVPLLGAVAYLRLDLVPALATILAIERLQQGRAGSTGAWLGLGTAAKLYPLLLLPAVFVGTRRWRPVAVGAAIAGLVPLLPFLPFLGDAVESVLGYHASRGVHIESTWGLVLVLVRGSGDVPVDATFGGVDVVTSATSALKLLATGLGFAVLLVSVIRAHGARDDLGRLGTVLLGALAAWLGVANVFSPQFMLWVLALGAAVLTLPRVPTGWPAVALLVAAGLTQLVFPANFHPLLEGDPAAVLPLLSRNLVVLGLGIGLLARPASRPVRGRHARGIRSQREP